MTTPASTATPSSTTTYRSYGTVGSPYHEKIVAMKIVAMKIVAMKIVAMKIVSGLTW